MGKRVACVLATLVVAVIPAVAAARLGMGGGPGLAIGNQFKIGALEMFSELHGGAWLSSRFTICYLPPLMPTEAAAMFAALGARAAWGDSVRPFAVVNGGVVVEPMGFRGFGTSFAWGATVGVEMWVTPSLGLYAAASATFSQRQTSQGVVSYPYFAWTIGVFVASPTVSMPRALPVGVEE